MDDVFTLGPGPQPRRYRVRGPGPVPGRPLPVVLILHGAGGTAAWTLGETGWGDFAEHAGFLAVLPEGTRADPSSPPGFLRNPQVWNDGSPRGALGQPGVDDVAFLTAVLDDVQARFPIDPARVYVTGFSNGAGMAFRLAAERSERLAALAPVAGHCWVPDPQLARPLPTLYLVGTADPLVPVEGGAVVSLWGEGTVERPAVRQTLHTWACALGCPEVPGRVDDEDGTRVEVYGPGRAGVELVALFVAGLGHHWPGGRGQLNPRVAGPPSDRVNANETIWRFFQTHSAHSGTPQ